MLFQCGVLPHGRSGGICIPSGDGADSGGRTGGMRLYARWHPSRTGSELSALDPMPKGAAGSLAGWCKWASLTASQTHASVPRGGRLGIPVGAPPLRSRRTAFGAHSTNTAVNDHVARHADVPHRKRPPDEPHMQPRALDPKIGQTGRHAQWSRSSPGNPPARFVRGQQFRYDFENWTVLTTQTVLG